MSVEDRRRELVTPINFSATSLASIDQTSLNAVGVRDADAAATAAARDPTIPYLVRTPSFSGDTDGFAKMTGGKFNTSRVWFSEEAEGVPSCDPRVGLQRVKTKCEAAMSVMKQNFMQVVERGSQMEVMVDKSGTLAQTTTQFSAQSKALERQMLLQKVMLPLIGLLIVVVLMVIIAFINPILFWFILVSIFASIVGLGVLYLKKRHESLLYRPPAVDATLAAII